MEDLRYKNTLVKDIKTFQNLEDEVISTNNCCACGACIAYCISQGFDVIKMEEYTPKFISNKNADKCKECGVCYYICPQTKPLLEEITTKYQIEDELGYIKDYITAKTTNEKIKEFGQDGGVVSTALTYFFERNKIDAAIVSEKDEYWNPIPKIIYNKEDLKKSAGTRYSISSNIIPLKDIYNIAQEIIKEKKHIYDINQLRIAFVGTPCQCRAIRKMQFLNISPSHLIKFVIGLFCMENFDHEKLFEIVKDETNLEPLNISKMNIKKNFLITSKDNDVKEVELKKFDDAVRNHCHLCDEFTSKFADFSVGGSGAPRGHSSIIIRTEIGQEVIDSLISEGYIEKYSIPADQKSSEWKNKKLNLFKRMNMNKINKNK